MALEGDRQGRPEAELFEWILIAGRKVADDVGFKRFEGLGCLS